ncbi:hypothetical protein IJ670_06895, partial [bacterium]|nr:hypothetical protein [bacterium]
ASKGYQKQEREVLYRAIDAIKTEIGNLGALNSVIYFLNNAKIQEYKKEIETILEQQQQLELQQQDLQSLQDRILEITQGLSVDEFKNEYNKLKTKLETTNAIQSIGQLRIQIDTLQDVVDYNDSVLLGLSQKYTSMTNSEFENRMMLLY